MKRFLLLPPALLWAGVAVAQGAVHDSGHHEGHARPAAAYGDLVSREIKALPPDEIESLRAGRGMALALPAELNGHPGPLHTLEHAQALGLSAEQLAATEALMARHRDEARRLGAAVVEAERALDAAFARGTADAAEVRTLVAKAARLRGELRASHLLAHIEQTRLLSAAQVERYQRLRGYAKN